MSSSARYFKQAQVIRYDPKIRDYVVLPSGDADSMHPVDQRVALCLNILQGSMSGDPTLGNSLRNIKKLNTSAAIADAKRAVITALQDIVSDGEITILDITVVFPTKGRMDIYIVYRNEVLSKSLQPRNTSITMGGS